MKWPDDFINKVICGDCLEVMKYIPDGEVDLVVTDPPYGIGFDYHEYDDSEEALDRLVAGAISEIWRINPKRIAVTCGVTNIAKYPKPKWILCWSYAPSTNKLACWGFGQWQPILVYGKDPYLEKSMGARPDMIHDMRPPQANGHPCPKPLTFMRKLIDRCSVDTKDIILDPFAGSGTTLVAAKQLGRKYIGIEINPDYCRIAEDRLRQEELF